MKKIFLTIACICAGLMFSSCGSDNDDNNPTSQDFVIDARNVENGNDYSLLIDSVKAITNYDRHDYITPNDIVATTNYINGGFIMTLPSFIANVMPIKDIWGGTIPNTININDPNAKVLIINDLLAYKAGEEIGDFKWINIGDPRWVIDGHFSYVEYVYADRDITINGTHSTSGVGDINDGKESTAFDNLSLKKGWNEIYSVYSQVSENESLTVRSNTKPAGLKWIFYPR
ncbi:MAG: hypothetical protein LBC68_01490 [Prevotellaceae bacterium]|nr:hypothetical protein [Prevotellaceae bacterium]